jgi:hypothetical protein
MIESIIRLSRLDEIRLELSQEEVDLYELAFQIKNDLVWKSGERRYFHSPFVVFTRRSRESSRFFMK